MLPIKLSPLLLGDFKVKDSIVLWFIANYFKDPSAVKLCTAFWAFQLVFRGNFRWRNWYLCIFCGGFSSVEMLNISVWWLTKRGGWQQTPKFSFKPLITDTYILSSYSKVAALETSPVRVVCNGPGSKGNIEIFWQQINRTGSRDWGWTRWPLKLQFDKEKLWLMVPWASFLKWWDYSRHNKELVLFLSKWIWRKKTSVPFRNFHFSP